MNRIILFFTMITLALIPLFGEELECIYIEGEADYLDGSEWFPLDFGITVDSGSKIRLYENSAVQLESHSKNLFFSTPGEFFLEKVASPALAARRESAFDKVSQKINFLFTDNKSESTTVMGIRGDQVDSSDALGFDSTSEEDINKAWKKMKHGLYEDAERDLELLYDMSSDPYSEGYLTFSLAYAEEMQGKTGEAWQHLGDIIMPEQGSYYPSYLLLSGQIAMKSQNYVEAAASYRSFLQMFPDHDTAEEVSELLALCEGQY